MGEEILQFTHTHTHDVVDNIPGATQRLLDQVDNDKKQIKLIGKDFTTILLRRADD